MDNTEIKINEPEQPTKKQNKEYFKQWREKNREKINNNSKEYYKKRVLENVEYRIKFNERTKENNIKLKGPPRPVGRPKKIILEDT